MVSFIQWFMYLFCIEYSGHGWQTIEMSIMITRQNIKRYDTVMTNSKPTHNFYDRMYGNIMKSSIIWCNFLQYTQTERVR